MPNTPTKEGVCRVAFNFGVVVPVLQTEIRLYLSKLTLMENEEFSYLLARLRIVTSFFRYGVSLANPVLPPSVSGGAG
ncbi:hypothetical protein SAMN05443550_11280 [Pedobacter hartonius]|uniref:Uncharacterized protein n=1 Tax=Pedobacter hartonius TaxID=425514 RepID=A0A1H4GZ82_9SPHI|nr:hypothetical protein SAMN05443550_11280 [Pedobacter hartonius]